MPMSAENIVTGLLLALAEIHRGLRAPSQEAARRADQAAVATLRLWGKEAEAAGLVNHTDDRVTGQLSEYLESN